MNFRMDQNIVTNKNDMGMDAGIYTRSSVSVKTGHHMDANRTAGYVAAQGYNVSFDGNLDQTHAYKNGTAVDESVIAAAGNAAMNEIAVQKDYMLVMSSTVSDEELAKIQDEGYKPGEMQPDEIVTVVDEIKEKLAAAGTIIAGYNDDIDLAKLEEITGSKISAEAIKNAMNEYQLPDTKENEEAFVKGMDIVKQIEAMYQGSNKTFTEAFESGKKYLLENHMQPTLENIYLAMHSGASSMGAQSSGYFADGNGYYGRKADSQDIAGLSSQMDKIISGAGYAINDDTRNDARWMVENGLTLTEESFKELQKINMVSDAMSTIGKNGETAKQQDIANMVARAMKDGVGSTNAIPGEVMTYEQKTVSTMQELSLITEEDVAALSEDESFTIQNLVKIHHENHANIVGNEAGDAKNILNYADHFLNTDELTKETVVKDGANIGLSEKNTDVKMMNKLRVVYEVQLRMTVSSGAFLLRNGINIDTRDLNKLVDDLKFAIQQKNEILFRQGDAAENQKAAELFDRTNEIVRSMPTMPAVLVGSLSIRSSFTLNVAYEEGSAFMAKYERAEERYETLMTAPRQDLGDSMRKAFRNVDALMEENGIDVNEANAKAVRILGYNEMEITAANVERVRDSYEQLTRVVSKLTPAMTLSLIRDKKNPLEMTMQDLEAELDRRQAVDGLDASRKEVEKYSHFLVRMQEHGQISQEEQNAFIGIYRMLHQIEKRDSAAIGAVLNQGAEVTFRNLLSSVRSNQNKGMDFSIDDKFGALDQVVTKGVSITEQLSQFFDSANIAAENVDNNEVHVADDNSKLSEEILENIKQMREVNQVSQEAINLLSSQNIPLTMDNLMAAEEMISHRGAIFKQAFAVAGKNVGISANSGVLDNSNIADSMSGYNTTSANTEIEQILENNFAWEINEAAFTEAAENLQNAFTDEVSAKSAYEEMAQKMQSILESGIDQTTNMLELRSIQASMKQISLASKLSKEECYEVPVKIGEEVTSINVRLIHAAENGGKVSIYSESEKYGKLQATFEQTEKGLSGYVVGDHAGAIQELDGKRNQFVMDLQSLLSDAISDEFEISSLHFVHTERFQMSQFAQIKEDKVNNLLPNADENNKVTESEVTNADRKRISTKALYETAKAFITLLG